MLRRYSSAKSHFFVATLRYKRSCRRDGSTRDLEVEDNVLASVTTADEVEDTWSVSWPESAASASD